jgi:putative ABC transport system permease protein
MIRVLAALRMWLRALVRRGEDDNDLAREIAAHLAMEQEALERAGVPLAEAHRQARVHFGALEQHKEAVRDERGTRLLQDVAADFRLAWRGLRRRPLFAGGVLLTLGIGIGATTAVFAWANWLLWRPVSGVSKPSELVPMVFVRMEGDRFSPFSISVPHFIGAQRSSPILRRSTAFSETRVQIGRADVPARTVDAEVVAGDYFGVLGVKPALGRFFAPEELDPSAGARVAVISDALWRSHFGGTGDAIGRRLQINAQPFSIIGVTAPAFRGVDRTESRDIWLPASTVANLRHSPSHTAGDPSWHILDRVVVRLPPGTTAIQAKTALQQSLTGAVAGTEDSTMYTDYPPTIDGVFGTSFQGYTAKLRIARMLLGIVSIVLLIACANTANLLLLRGVRRRGEFAIRRALGASTARVLRQHAAEGLVLACLGAVVGLVLALVLARLFGHITSFGLPAFDHIPIDLRSVLVAFMLAIATALVFSLAPAVAALRASGMDDLRGAGRGSARRSAVIRGSLTVIQISAAMTLVVSALLLMRTIEHLGRVELGLDPRNVSTYTIWGDPQGYSSSRLHALRTGLIDWMRHQPGVTAVATGASIQFGGSTYDEDLRPIGATGKHWPVHAASYGVSPGYFAALGIPFRGGRTFSDAEFDDTSSASVVLSQAAARQLLGTGNPVGQQVEVREYRGVTRLTVIGVVGDTRIYSLRDPVGPTIYRPSSGPFDFGTVLVVRSTEAEKQVQRAVEAGVARFDPSLPLGRGEMLSDAVADVFARERLLARLLGVLAAIAVALSGIGLYSVIAYAVSERTRELGIRMALGAAAGRVISLVMRQGLLLAAIGVVAGTAGAYTLSQALRQQLFGVAATDGPTYLVAGAMSLVIGLLACAIPARSATRVNPVEALRRE